MSLLLLLLSNRVSSLLINLSLNLGSAPFFFQTALFGSERNATIMSAEPLRPPPLLGATPSALPLRSGTASGSTGAPHQLEAEEDEGHGGSSSRGQQVAILPDSMSSYTSVLFPVVRKKGAR